jgi:hypothetical protein
LIRLLNDGRWNSQIDLSESHQLFLHLSSDYDLVPIAALKDVAGILRAKNLKAGLNEGDEVIYEPMINWTTSSQVSPYTPFVHSDTDI